MAVVNATREAVVDHVWKVVWPNLANGDTGDPVTLPKYADRTVQIVGNTWGVSGSVTLEGSLDGTNWFPLTDLLGTDITYTANKLETITELVQYVRPNVTNGDGTTDITVTLLLKEAS